jgi:hypothetical protein
VSNWPALLLTITVVLVLRWQGNSWPMAVAKLVGMGVIYLAVVTILGIVIARLW